MKFELPRPSVYTPFLRRFTDERARDLADTKALYQRVRARHLNSSWVGGDAVSRVSGEIAVAVREFVGDMPDSTILLTALDQCQYAILEAETTIFAVPEIDWPTAILTLQEQVDLRRFLRAQEYFLANEGRVSARMIEALSFVFAGLIGNLPTLTDDDAATFTVPLITTIGDPNGLVDKLIGTVMKADLAEMGLFTALQETLYRNVCVASGVSPEVPLKKPPINADDSDLPPVELVDAYMRNTPFRDLLLTPIPFSLPEASRFEHTHIVAGSGHGKTQTLQHLIMHDLMRDPADVPGLVIIDSQGDMLDKLARLDLFDPDHGVLADRLIIIDPTDIEHPPALGLFDVDLDRLGRYSARDREQIMNGVIELYDYIFGGLLGAELTQKQNVIFRYLARLMLVIPDATILTLKDVMQDASPFVPYFDRLDGMARDFFRHEFHDRQFAETKKQILRRLWGVLENPTFERLFSNPRNKLDMFGALNSGKIVLVNTAKDFLKAERSSILGRFFIALTFQAALERAALPEHARRPAFLYIDEAADYFDDTIDSLLSQARKFKLGVVFAHQYLDQLPRPLLASIMTNTSVKFAGGVSASDAHALARNMGTTSEIISGVRKRAKETEFAVYVRNVTESAVTLTVPLGTLENAPTMHRNAFHQLTMRNRVAIATSRDEARQPRLASPSHDTPPGVATSVVAVHETKAPSVVPVAQPRKARSPALPVTPEPSAPDDDWRS